MTCLRYRSAINRANSANDEVGPILSGAESASCVEADQPFGLIRLADPLQNFFKLLVVPRVGGRFQTVFRASRRSTVQPALVANRQ